MSVPAPSEKYSAASEPHPSASPKSASCRALAPGTSMAVGMSCLSMRMAPPRSRSDHRTRLLPANTPARRCDPVPDRNRDRAADSRGGVARPTTRWWSPCRSPPTARSTRPMTAATASSAVVAAVDPDELLALLTAPRASRSPRSIFTSDPAGRGAGSRRRRWSPWSGAGSARTSCSRCRSWSPAVRYARDGRAARRDRWEGTGVLVVASAAGIDAVRTALSSGRS